MKKIFLIIALTVAAGVVSAQKVRINLYGAYVFDDAFENYYNDYDYYYGTIEGGFQGGAGLEYMASPMLGLEIVYLRQSTNAPTYYQRDYGLPVDYENFVLGLDYVMLGFTKHYLNASGKFEGYGGLLLGVGFVGLDSPSRGTSDSGSRFSWAARLGGNIWATPRMGIKLQAQLISLVQGTGGGLYFGTGGAGVGVSTYSTVYQFGLGGGLVFVLGK